MITPGRKDARAVEPHPPLAEVPADHARGAKAPAQFMQAFRLVRQAVIVVRQAHQPLAKGR
ncbi:MAG: hypothetical protein AB1453_01950 [Chloroflexota bacterium]